MATPEDAVAEATGKPEEKKKEVVKVRMFYGGFLILFLSLLAVLAFAFWLITFYQPISLVGRIILVYIPLILVLWGVVSNFRMVVIKRISEIRLVEVKMVCPKCGTEGTGYDEQTHPAGRVTWMATGTCNPCLTQRRQTVALERA